MYDKIPVEKRSALAEELRSMPPRVLELFRIPTDLIPMLDAATAVIHDLLDDDDPRRWDQRLADGMHYFEAVDFEEKLETRLGTVVQWFESKTADEQKDAAERYVRRFKNGNIPRFLLRLLGRDVTSG